MNSPRSVSRRLALALVLACTLLAVLPASQAMAQKKMPPPVALTPELFGKVEAVVNRLVSDEAAMRELQAINKEDELDPTIAETDGAVVKKYPALAAVYGAAGIKPHEFVDALITIIVADRYASDNKEPDAEMTRANIDFVKANHDRASSIIRTVTDRH